MNTLSLILCFIITGASLFTLKPLAEKIGLIDLPGGRKDHTSPTPLIGGLGIYIGVVLVSLITPNVIAQYAPLLLISSIILIIGTLDDYKQLPVSLRMGSQALAGSLMYFAANNQLTSFGELLFSGDVALGAISFPLTVFATVGVINAINMSDGIDGLSGGMVTIALGFLGFSAYQAGNTTLLAFIAILISALLAFLTLNFRLPWNKPAMVYLGDAGSTLLGFILAWLLIESSQGDNAVIPPVMALCFLAVPLIDTVTLLIKRPLEGKSSFEPDRDHLHHILLKKGLSKTTVILILWGLNLLLGCLSLIALSHSFAQSTLFLSFMTLFGFYFLIRKLTPSF